VWRGSRKQSHCSFAMLVGHQPRADAMQKALLAYGKQLFLDEWMNQLERDEDKTQALNEGGAEFDRILSGG
jgi:hypothetical protein